MKSRPDAPVSVIEIPVLHFQDRPPCLSAYALSIVVYGGPKARGKQTRTRQTKGNIEKYVR